MNAIMTAQLDDLASAAEVAAALLKLTDADLVRLKLIAQLRTSGLVAIEWKDLINEAVCRALGETRRWPRNVPFIAFLAQTMRSIANEERRRLHQEKVTLESDLGSSHVEGELITLDDLAENPVHPEREELARKTLEEIEALFKDDVEALALLNGLADGLTPDEIQIKGDMNKIQYASSQKRIRRKLAREFLTEGNQS
jgi:DNA-directed RNA polymerase specialized sigma24 family protein